VADGCAEYARLQSEVSSILQHLSDLATAQLEAFYANDPATFAKLDKQLEITVGEKERAIGAMREHAKDHGCQLVWARPESE
jgi:hypothetical protein